MKLHATPLCDPKGAQLQFLNMKSVDSVDV
jgi:hypothetical protein